MKKAPNDPGVMRRILNSARRFVDGLSYQLQIARANRWRDSYNPLRSLTMARLVLHLEAGERGAFAEIQWLYRYIERRDAVVGALMDRRLGAIEKLNWDIKLPDELPDGVSLAMAEAQQRALKAAYHKITNLGAALGHLAKASFRGYAHLQKLSEGGVITRLDPVQQWHWVRDGLYGEWQFSAAATMGTNRGDPVTLTDFVTREVERPINEVAAIAFVRKGLSQKDWDGFIETYGIPPLFLLLPPELSDTQREEFQTVAESIIGDGRGVLPGNSEIKTIDNGSRGANPFKEHIDYQDAQVVLRGTGGKLAMLNDPTGIGGGQADVHERVFEDLAKAEAAAISEILREQLDPELLLQEGWGDAPVVAYFELAANEETDSGAFLDGVVKLESAGYETSGAQITETTGYEVKRKTTDAPLPPPRLQNRKTTPSTASEEDAGDPFLAAAADLLAAARDSDRDALRTALREALLQEDDAALVTALEQLGQSLPDYVDQTDAAALAWEQILSAAYLLDTPET